MCRAFCFRYFAAGAMAFVCAVMAGPAFPADEASANRPVYHPDPAHLWNRLHEALLVRRGPDGKTYGQDRLEPLLWPESKHLLVGVAHKTALAVLEEFLKTNGERLIDDPLKRAVLQRDLWLVFNWLEGSHDDLGEPRPDPLALRAAKEKLRRPLAAVIGRLALTRDEIRKLPDNYAARVSEDISVVSEGHTGRARAKGPPHRHVTSGGAVAADRKRPVARGLRAGRVPPESC
jgi:hypothetical protein